MKIGIADNAKKRFAAIQTGNWAELTLLHHWWMAGKLLTERVEREAGKRLKAAGKHLRGEWFDIEAGEARMLLLSIIREFGFSAMTEAEMVADEARRADKKLDAIMGGRF